MIALNDKVAVHRHTSPDCVSRAVLRFSHVEGRTLHHQKDNQSLYLQHSLFCGGLEPDPQYL